MTASYRFGTLGAGLCAETSSVPKLTAVPALRSQKRTLRAKQNIVFGLLGALCFTGPLALVIVARQPDPYVPAAPIGLAAAPTYVIAFAHQAAEDYLSGAGTLLPVGGKDVIDKDFNGVESGMSGPLARSAMQLSEVKRSTYATSNGDAPSWEVAFSFRLKKPDGSNSAAMLLIVHVRLDTYKFPILAAVPSLVTDVIQVRAVEGGAGVVGLSGAEISPPAAAQAAVNAWASLYVSDERAGLKAHVNTGSGKDNYEYQGLSGGFTLRGQPTIIVAGDRGDGHIVARVRLDLENGSYRISTEMDVLIINQNPAFVQAWGAVGSGDYLQPWVSNKWPPGP